MRSLRPAICLGTLTALLGCPLPAAIARDGKDGDKLPAARPPSTAPLPEVVKDPMRDVLRKLLDGLRSKDRVVQVASSKALVELMPKGPDTVSALLELAGDPDPEVARSVRQALYRTGKPGMEALIAATKDKRAEVRAAAVHVLGQYRKKEESKVVVPVIIRVLRDESSLVRRDAACALRCFPGEAEQVVPALVRALDDKDVAPGGYGFSVAALAAGSLEHLGPAAKAAVPGLLKALKSPTDKQAHLWILLALGKSGAGDKEALQALVTILKDKKEGEWRAAAAAGLSNMGPKAKPAISDLLEVFKDTGEKDAAAGERLRETILTSLQMIGPGAEAAVPDLVEILSDKMRSSSERSGAARALGGIGPAANMARRALMEAAKEKDRRVKWSAQQALDKLGR